MNPRPASRYNLVVIGGGTAGLVTAAGAAGLGARVALIEKHLLGGDCLNVGCVPSKALIRAARAAAGVREAIQFGVRVEGEVRVDFGAVMERMRRLRADISPHDSAARFQELGVDVFLGAGRFVDSDAIEVGGQRLRFAKAVIATGARAAAPPIPGLAEVPYLTNETLFSLTELPKRLGIIGAGPIGCEMAQSFARFGSEVYLVETTHGILPREDRDAAQIVHTAMARDGVRLLCCGKDLKLSPSASNVRLQVESHGEGYDLVVDRLLVAVGRAPNVEGLGLEAAGVSFDQRGVHVDERLQTTNRRIYACGDICSPHKFTHAADFLARIVIRNALFMGRSRASSLQIPWCTYPRPRLLMSGCTKGRPGRRAWRSIHSSRNWAGSTGPSWTGKPRASRRCHVRRGTDRIVGATVVAAHAGDLICELTLAMKGHLGLKTIGATIHPYPTQADAIRRTGDLHGRTRLTPFLRSVFSQWLAWQRR